MSVPLPTKRRLEELFLYDKDNGFLIRKITVCSRGLSGSVVGKSFQASGYSLVQVDGHQYWLHRLIWRICYGRDPKEKCIDHIDGNRRNNKIENLRLANKSQNGQNRFGPNKNNYSGLIGVYRTKSERFCSKIKINRKSIWLGTYDTEIDAHRSYLAAKRKLHEFNGM